MKYQLPTQHLPKYCSNINYLSAQNSQNNELHINNTNNIKTKINLRAYNIKFIDNNCMNTQIPNLFLTAQTTLKYIGYIGANQLLYTLLSGHAHGRDAILWHTGVHK